MKRKPTCIAVDFDFTLTHFVGGLDELFAIFVRRGVLHSDAVTAEARAEELGFTIAAYIQCVREMGYTVNDDDAIAQEFAAWLAGALAFYEDTPGVLQVWVGTGTPLVVVTFGNAGYQRLKVETMRVPHTAILIASHETPKLTHVRALLARYGAPIWFIEDKPAELDAVRAAGFTEDQVRTFRIDRPDSPYAAVQSTYTHVTVSSLCDVR